MGELFEGRHFDREVRIFCVCRYCRFKRSLRDQVEIMTKRALSMAHTTIIRWVRYDAPEFVKRWNRFGARAGRSWRVDKTHLKIRGRWTYLYRALDRTGNTVDCRRRTTRNAAAAKAFFKKAIKSQGETPDSITPGGYAASHRAVLEMKADGLLRDHTQI